MKKIIASICAVVLMFSLVGCNNTKEQPIKILSPVGAPSFAQVYMQATKPNLGRDYAVTVKSGTSFLVSAFGSDEYDIIYAPTDMGSKFYAENGKYLFGGMVTWGNLHFMTDADVGTDFTLSDMQDKEVVIFGGANSSSYKLARYILDSNSITYTVKDANDVNTANTMLLNGGYHYILSAEPAMSALIKKAGTEKSFKTIDLSAEWEKKQNGKRIAQAGVFVSKKLVESNKAFVDKFLAELAISAGKVSSDVSAVADKAVELGKDKGYAFTKDVLVSALPNCNIEYKSATDSKSAVETFFDVMKVKLPADAFYYAK